MANLRSGFGEIKKTVEKQKQSFTPPTGKLNYFSLEVGEIVYVRFLEDFPVTAKFYEWIINNQGKTSEFICAPDLYKYDPDWKGEDWVQKWTSPTPGIGWAKKWKSDELTLPKLADRTVGIAVKRELVPETPGATRDLLEEIDVDNEKQVALHFMLVRQALSNFWDQMVGYHGLYGTICDRDYRIERKGEGFKTTYQAIGMNPDPDWNYDGSSLRAMQAYYGYGVKLKQDKDDSGKVTGTSVVLPDLPEEQLAPYKGQDYTWENRYLYCPTTVNEWCENRASEEFAEYWLNPKAEHLDKPATNGAVTAEQLQQTRPSDPRQQSTATPVTVTPTPAAAPAPVDVAPPPASPESPVTEAPSPAAPAEPVSGDRFEQMRAQMAARQAGASK